VAEKAAEAFGHFMKTLRRRRGFSLPDVCRFFEHSPDRIDKGTLSRLERGQQGLALAKIGSLSRIYGVSPEVPIERFELDREVEQRDGPETEGLSVRELLDAGRTCLLDGSDKVAAYAYFRDAVMLADDEGKPPDDAELISLRFNLATSERGLGKNGLALYEFTELEVVTRRTENHGPVLERISNCQRCLGNLAEAERCAHEAIREAKARSDFRTVGFAYDSLANINMARGGAPETTAEFLALAYRANRSAEDENGPLRPSVSFEINTLNRLAECYLDAGREHTARRAAISAKALSEKHGVATGLGFAELYLGCVDERQGLDDRAEARWRTAQSIADATGNKRLQFASGFYRYRMALRLGENARARALSRKLDGLAPWLSNSLPLVDRYRDLSIGSTAPSRNHETRGSTPNRPNRIGPRVHVPPNRGLE